MPVSDPIALELFKNAIFSIADEMALTVFRTTYSGVLKDNMDYSTGFADANGKLAAQGLTLPGHLGSVPTAMESIMRHFKDDMAEGDVFIMNDPFDGGMHLPDIFVFKPLYPRGRAAGLRLHRLPPHRRRRPGRRLERVGFDRDLRRGPAHRADEALRQRAVLNKTIMTFIEKNVRLPVQLFGDLRAQLAACHIGEKQFAELVARYGAEETKFYLNEVIDYAERLTRAAIQELPDGEWSFEDWIDDDGVDYGKPIRLFVTITQEGRPHGGRLDGHQPAGEGRDQQHALLHQGRLLHRRALGAAAGHPQQRGRVPRHRGDLPAGHGRQRRAAGGLRGARPDRLPHGRLHVRRARHDAARQGEGGGRRRQHRHLDRRLRRRARKPFVYVDFTCGAWGARPCADGLDGNSHMFANMASHSIEVTEAEQPIQLLAYEFVADKAGAGKYRGGVPFRRDYRFLETRRHAAGPLRPARSPPVRPLWRQPGRRRRRTISIPTARTGCCRRSSP